MVGKVKLALTGCIGIFDALFSLSALATNYQINGDTTTYLNFSVNPGAANGQPNSITSCYQMVGKPAGATWSVNGSTSTTGTFTRQVGTLISATTSGIPIAKGPTTPYYIAIGYSFGTSGCTPNVDNNYLVVDPSISISPTSVSITQPNTSSYATVTATLSPATSGLQVTGTCVGTNGPQFSPMTVTANAGLNGTVNFPTITASNLVLVRPPGIPTAVCTFTAGGSSSAALTFQTFSFDPTITLSPTTATLSGATGLTATISPSYQGVVVNTSCSWSNSPPSGTTASVSPASQPMGSTPQLNFTVNTSKLDFIDPVLTDPVPTATCTFSVPNGSHTATVQIPTGNQCSPALGLAPRPPGC